MQSLQSGARLRITTALDVRENKLVEARSAQTNQLLGTFDIRFASICQPFEIALDAAKAQLAAREGVRLQMTSGQSALWVFNGKGGAPEEFAPRWVEEVEKVEKVTGDKWAQFEERLCSLASVQAFGWIEGCVLDGLWQMARAGGPKARAAIESHLQLFISAGGDLDYEGPGSDPRRNAIYGMEGLLPFAIMAQVSPTNRVLDLAIDFCQKHHDAQGAVADGGNTTTEGVYIAGYPLAVIGQAQNRDDLKQLALLQLRTRRERNVQNGTIFQSVNSEGVGRLPNWARGVAWYLLGFARVLDVLDPGAQADDLYREFKRAALWAMGFQQPDGLWRNFFDDPNSISDTSGSSGIATALALGARRGWLPDSARVAAASTCRGLEAHLTPDGFLGGMAQFNKGGEELQRANYRVMAPMAMGLAAQLRAELQSAMKQHGPKPSGDRTVVEKMPGLVAFWTFGEQAGQPRASSGTREEHPLEEVGGPIARVEGGPFSGYSAEFNGSRYLKIPYAQTRDLNIAGPQAQVSMFAVVRIVDLKQSRTIAGMWSEGKGRDDDTGTRQYALLMNMPTYGGPRQLVPHISSEGGVTRRADGSAFPWCADYAATKQEVPEEQWCSLAFTYDGQYIRAYINGLFEERPLNAAADKRDDPYFTSEGPGGKDRGMNPFFHGRGIFQFDAARHAESKPGGGSDFTVGARYAVGSMLGEATRGKFGGLAVFNRALRDEEIKALHDAANIASLNQLP